MSLRQDSSIAIVGGSLTGPTLALLLMKAGFTNVDVYEAMPGAIPQAGGVIGLHHPALEVLDTLGIGQDEIIPFPSERVISVKVLNRETRRVQQLWPGRSTTWNVLNAALMERMPSGRYHNSRRVVDLGQDGRASLHFKKGEPVEAEFVAFADGRRSIGRQILDPGRPLIYAGYVAHRGQVAYDPEVFDFMSYNLNRAQFNTFPVPFGDGLGVDWTFYLSMSEQQFTESFGGPPDVRTFVTSKQIKDGTRQFVNDAAERLLPSVQAELVRTTTQRAALPIVDIAVPEHMSRPVGDSTAVMVGDALAPVRPHTAMGANNGIEEAAGLAVALKQTAQHGADLSTALEGWQTRYMPLIKEALERGPQLSKMLGLGLE